MLRLIGAIALFAIAERAAAQDASPRQRTPVVVVGVYDAQAGTPIEGANVADLGSGSSGVTLGGGIVAFVRRDTGATFISVRKLGYRSEMIAVTTGARDTVPVTVILQPVQALPAVVSKARAGVRGPADTVRRLELNGFYDRRLTTGAPSSSFLTAEKVEKLSLVSDAAALTGRAFCNANLYLDGVRVLDMAAISATTKVPKARGYRSLPIDQLVSPGEVLAIEFYRVGDTPVDFNSTKPAGSPDCGATLIWTK